MIISREERNNLTNKIKHSLRTMPEGPERNLFLVMLSLLNDLTESERRFFLPDFAASNDQEGISSESIAQIISQLSVIDVPPHIDEEYVGKLVYMADSLVFLCEKVSEFKKMIIKLHSEQQKEVPLLENVIQ